MPAIDKLNINPISDCEMHTSVLPAGNQDIQDQAIYTIQTLTFEQLRFAMENLLWLASQQNLVMHQIQLHDEELRMKYTNKEIASYRSCIPVIISCASIGFGLAHLAVSINPKGIFDLCKKVPGTEPLLKKYMPDKSQTEDLLNLKPDIEKFSKDINNITSTGQKISEQVGSIQSNFAQADRTQYKALAEVAQNRTGEWSRKTGSLDNEKSQFFAALAKAAEDEQRTKEILAR